MDRSLLSDDYCQLAVARDTRACKRRRSLSHRFLTPESIVAAAAVFASCTRKMALDILAGSIGGIAQVFAGHPLDTVKVRVSEHFGDSY